MVPYLCGCSWYGANWNRNCWCTLIQYLKFTPQYLHVLIRRVEGKIFYPWPKNLLAKWVQDFHRHSYPLNACVLDKLVDLGSDNFDYRDNFSDWPSNTRYNHEYLLLVYDLLTWLQPINVYTCRQANRVKRCEWGKESISSVLCLDFRIFPWLLSSDVS